MGKRLRWEWYYNAEYHDGAPNARQLREIGGAAICGPYVIEFGAPSAPALFTVSDVDAKRRIAALPSLAGAMALVRGRLLTPPPPPK